MWTSWVVVENAPDIGHQALMGVFHAYSPKQAIFSHKFMQSGVVCIEFPSKDHARNACIGNSFI